MKTRKIFTENLVRWYRKNARDLPWRETKDPYKIWISEIMLQQTTVNAVIPYYKKWIRHFPTVRSVSRAPLQKILKVWQGLGYYSRAKNIHKSAEIICRDYGGKVPESYALLKKLPGFGPYTVGAVLSIAFDKRFPIVDANIRRVVMRQLAYKGIADSKYDRQITKFMEWAMPNRGVNIFNQAVMELGALVCRAREPLCSICPVRISCVAYRSGLQEIIPEPKKKVIKDVDAVIALIKRRGSYFIQQRPSKGLFADLWEFPGGKVEKGESEQNALKREVREELAVTVESAKHLMNLTQYYTEFKANLHVWSCHTDKLPLQDETHKWVKLKDLHSYPMPSGSARIVDRLRKI